MISAAVHEILLPIMKEIKNDLNSVKNDLSSLNKTVSNLSGDLEDYKQQTASELAGLQSNVTSELAGLQSTTSDLHRSLQSNTQQLCAKMDTLDLKMASFNASMREELRAMESQLEEYKQQTASELAGLQSNVTSKLAGLQSNVTSELAGLQSNVESELAGLRSNATSELAGLLSNVESQLATIENTTSDLHNSLQSNTQKLAQLCAKMDTLNSKVISQCTPVPLSSTPTTLISPTSLPSSPTSLPPSPTSLPPSPTSLPSPHFSCGGTGGWRRVVYLNFTDPNTTCPSGWQLTSHSKRTCGRVSTGQFTCDSVTFPVSGGDYTRVCGRIIAYQDGHTEGFEAYHVGWQTTIDGAYVDGVSLTHGSPRQHIWTFAVGYSELYNIDDSCPCDATININIPPFVGGDYFCESGWNSGPYTTFFPDNPLWEGDGCTASSTCCSFNNPPYFTKELPSPTTDDIETRLCQQDSDGDTPIEFIELYVQ